MLLRTRGGRRSSVRTMLIAFALVPLLGGFVVGYVEVDDALDRRDQAAEVRQLVVELIETTELRAAIIDERNLSSAVVVVAELGFDPALMNAVIDFDLTSQIGLARAEVDRLLPDSVFADQADRMLELRGSLDGIDGTDTVDVGLAGQAYTAFELELGAVVDERIDELISAAGRLRGNDDLVTTLRVFAAASDARASLSQMSTSSLSAFFGLSDPDGRSARELVISDDALAHANLELIERLADPGSESLAALDLFMQMPETQNFLEVSREIGLASDFETIEITEVVSRLDELVTVFTDGDTMVDSSFTLVAASGRDVLEAAENVEEAARAEAVRIMVIVLAAALLGVVAVALLIRAILRPVARLAEGAERIRDGRIDQRIPEDGPTEIRAAALALNEATAGLEHFRDQTDALARGDVDLVTRHGEHHVGPLGDSIRTAVDTLAASIAARDELREQLLHEASHDSLTKVANRRASLDALRATLASRAEGYAALLFVDLDGFKQVNDQLGHRAGDVALRTVAGRLSGVIEGSHVGRLGGDEFVVIVESVASGEVAAEHARRLVEVVSASIDVEGTSVTLSASIGIALDDGHDASALSMLHEADVAVYEAKRMGAGSIRVCDADLREEIRRSAELERDIHRAIQDDEFELWLQPVVDSGGRGETSREALVRWRHPSRGIVMPGDFIEFAERSDLILAIDRWVLAEAARILSLDPDGTPIAVNVSGRHLGSDGFVDDVVVPLEHHGVDPARIIIEVTESAVLDDVAQAAASLEYLRSLGVRIAVDDFGTGYASLSYLRQLPLDVIKIDRSFTRDHSSRSLVSMVVETGRLLGVQVVAEGVEDADQADTLRLLGVDRMQGYHFGRPAPFAAVAADVPVGI